MLVSCDAKQLEFRVLLELARDRVGIAEIIDKQDTHELNRIAFSLPSRLISKIYLFRTIFRGSGWSFANDANFMHVSSDPKYWDRVNERFYEKYWEINKCHESWKDLVMSGEPIVGPLGREWLIPIHDPKGELYIPWTVFTNYPVQGTSADIMTLARVSLARRLQQINTPVLLIQTVHDSIVVDTAKENVQVVINIFHEVFRDLQANIKKIFNYDWVVPLECECKYGMNLKEIKDISYKM